MKRRSHIFQVDYTLRNKSKYLFYKKTKTKRNVEDLRGTKKDKNLRFFCRCDLLFPTSFNKYWWITPDIKRNTLAVNHTWDS